jgi:hypothetical protein
VTFTAADSAGNSTTASTTVTVADTIAPGIQIVSPQARDYSHADALIISFSAADGGSGLMAGSPESWLDGTPVTGGQSIALLTRALGDHVFTVSAMDRAANPAVRIVTFRVVATIDSLIAAVNEFAQQGQIDDSRMIKSLLSKLDEAKQAVARDKKSVAINKLNDLIAQINSQIGQHITSGAAQVLITDARYVIGTLQ